jgi:hypothetical protein
MRSDDVSAVRYLRWSSGKWMGKRNYHFMVILEDEAEFLVSMGEDLRLHGLRVLKHRPRDREGTVYIERRNGFFGL